jgi:hypothetical protein
MDAESTDDVGTERASLAEVRDPPFDGSEPCIFCPMEVRNLLAVAHNAVGAYEGVLNGHESPEQLARKMATLKGAMEGAQRLADAHFADRMHSHGQVNR